jgi:ribosome-associated heat shock protein Hsp15
MTGNETSSVRLDKWLWAARFFKTRPLARKAIEGGKVRVEGARAKAGRSVQVGQRLEIRQGLQQYTITVLALSDKRGPATLARSLYEECEESQKQREKASLERKAAAQAEPDFGNRPDKYQRRRIRKLLEKNEGIWR